MNEVLVTLLGTHRMQTPNDIGNNCLLNIRLGCMMGTTDIIQYRQEVICDHEFVFFSFPGGLPLWSTVRLYIAHF